MIIEEIVIGQFDLSLIEGIEGLYSHDSQEIEEFLDWIESLNN